MAIETYKPFADRMIGRYEGGYGWNRKDPGGPTKYGITCYDLAAYMGQPMNSMTQWAPLVQAMTRETADAIYASKYATAIRYNDLPVGPDVTMFDYGVNSGPARSIRSARAILGIPGRPVMDDALVSAIQKTDPLKFINAMDDERLHFMHGIRNGEAWAEFGGGWGARVADLRSYAAHLITAGSTAPTAPDLTKVAVPKAQHGDPELGKKTITRTTVGAGGASGTHFAGVPIELAAVLAGFVIVGGVGYYLYKKQEAAIANATIILPPPATPLKAAA